MSEIVPVKKPMTDEERLALATKMDKELDEFIDGLERQRYTDGWPEDRWEEEMDKHPFFMKKAPAEGEELHPLMEGMRQLKYDPMENTKEDLANTYREDGNYNVKHNNYRMAVYSYTEGIKQKSENKEVNSMLYNNRSAAQFFLKNYRSSLEDALRALALNPDYTKAKWRAAQCYHFMNQYDQCVKTCDEILLEDPKNQAAQDLRKTTNQIKASKTRDERKRNAVVSKKLAAIQNTIREVCLRKVRFEELKGATEPITEDLLRPSLLPLEDFPVHLDDSGCVLLWPTAFCYPEFLQSDFQQNLSEDVIMLDVLTEMFAEPLECEGGDKYRPDVLNVYYENRLTGKVHKVNVRQTIRKIISNENFLVSGGSLQFFVVVKESSAEAEYLGKMRKPLGN